MQHHHLDASRLGPRNVRVRRAVCVGATVAPDDPLARDERRRLD
jgi:hypothetical protein